MPFQIIQIDGNLLKLRFSGVLHKDEMLDLQRKFRVLIGLGRELRVLAFLENFKGWEKSAAWDDKGEDMEFMLEFEDKILKVALVGDERWKDDAFMFLGKGFRGTQIEFFPPEKLDEASAWLQA
jgi:hypothetical protein